MADKKLEYVVIKTGVSVEAGGKDLEVGSVVKLTEDQAKSRVNKVQLKSEAGSVGGKTGEKIKQLEADIGALQSDVSQHERDKEDIKGELELITIERDDLQEKIDASPVTVEQLTEALKAAKEAAK